MASLRVIGLVGIAFVAIGLGAAVTSANTVPSSRLADSSRAITADRLKPAECASLSLTALVVGSGTVTGTSANELIIGGPGADSIGARSGNDCVLAGGGADLVVQGEGGGDVLLGGPGADTLDGGLGTDACYGGSELDTFLSCETQVQ